MADNVPITAGTGTTIATDDVAGVHYQRIKVVDGPGSTNELAISASGGVAVDPRPTIVNLQVASAGLTIASTAYGANDVLGTGWEMTGFARASGGTGAVVGGVLNDAADIVTAIDVYLFDRAVTFGTDNAVVSISDADALFLQGKLAFTVDDLIGARAACIDTVLIPYRCNVTSLFAYAVTRVAHTFFGAVGDIKLRLIARLD